MKKAESILIVLTVLSVFQSRADVPTAPLTPVWENLAENGFVTVTADGIGADGKVCGRAGSRRFAFRGRVPFRLRIRFFPGIRRCRPVSARRSPSLTPTSRLST